jgi:hypothetical protein
MALTFAVIARIPAVGVEPYRRYETTVLALLPEHGGQMERRLATGDGEVEIHILAFQTADGFASFRQDPRRVAAEETLRLSGALTEVLEVHDIG